MKTIKFLAFTLLAIIGIMIFNSIGVEAVSVSTASFAGLVAYERQVFERLSNKFPGKVEPGHLRIQASLTNNNGTYKFDLKDKNTLAVNEKGLNDNDMFVATRLGLFLINEDDDRLGCEILQSYPNDQVFSGSGFTLKDMELIYAGGLEIKTNQTVNTEAIPGMHFRKVPQGQKTASVIHSEFDLMRDVYWLPTLLAFDGGKNMDIKYSFNTVSSMQIASVTAGYTHKLVFMPIGFLIKGGAGQKIS